MSDDLFSREEALAGHPGRQAHRILFLIESRAAHLAARSQRAMEIVADPTATDERDLAFLEAFRLGHEPPLRPTIRDLERFAPRWADLVPANPRARAALAHVLAGKYRLWRPGVPNMRGVLGLDTPEVQAAYERLYGAPLESIYATHVPLWLRMRWAPVRLHTWVDSLPPFWTAYSLSVTEVIGTAVLALPIAIAAVGVIPGLIILMLIGLVTTLTLASVSEAIARNGSVRYGDAYFGRLVSEYLGRPARGIFTGAIVLFSVLLLIALYAGVGATLSSAISLPPGAGVAILFACVLFLLTRRTLSATVSSALMTGAVSIALLVLMAGLALPHLDVSRLTHSNVSLTAGLSPSILDLVFGVVITAYFGHLSVGNCARVVLREDMSGRSLIWGGIAAQLTAIAVYCVWAIAIVGAVPAARLAHTSGTAISPLAVVAGPLVLALGAAYVVSGLGISAVNYSLALRNTVREWIPLQAGERLRLWLSLIPIVALFAGTEWTVIGGRATFVGPLEAVGVIVASALGGIYPMLLLAASRRKGEYVPGLVLRVLGYPLVVVTIYLLFLANLLVHGLVIWHAPVEQAGALLMFLLMLALPAIVIREGALRRRTVVELRWDAGDQASGVFSIVAAGVPLEARVTAVGSEGEFIDRASSGPIPALSLLLSLMVELPPHRSDELEIWLHHISEIGVSEGVEARVEVRCGAEVREYDVPAVRGRMFVPVADGACMVSCVMAAVSPHPRPLSHSGRWEFSEGIRSPSSRMGEGVGG